MKITVIFGEIRILVPCSSGDLRISDLIKKAVDRYRKVTKKLPGEGVYVRSVEDAKDHAILDDDDLVNEVLDDRDMVIANYEEDRPGRYAGLNVTDIPSASSNGTASPEMFTAEINHMPRNLNSIVDHQIDNGNEPNNQGAKFTNSTSTPVDNSATDDDRFTKGLTSRRSLGLNHPMLSNWAEEQDRKLTEMEDRGENESNDKNIKEPSTHYDGSHDRSSGTSDDENKGKILDKIGKTIMPLSANTKRIGKRVTIDLVKGEEGLGFTITSRDNSTGNDKPIYIKKVVSKGVAARDGRLKIGDRLLEVNDMDVVNKSRHEVVALLKSCIGVVRLVVSRQDDQENEDTAVSTNNQVSSEDVSPNQPVVVPEPQEINDSSPNPVSSVTPMSSLEPLPTPNDHAFTEPKPAPIIPEDFQMHTEIIQVKLRTSPAGGLGINVKGRILNEDSSSPTGRKDAGIFIKAIMPGSAADQDGRLLKDDRVIAVNNISLNHLANDEAMSTLKAIMKDAIERAGFVTFAVLRHTGTQVSMISDTMDSSHLLSNPSQDTYFKNSHPEDFLDDVVFTNDSHLPSPLKNYITDPVINDDPRSVPQQPKSFNPAADYANATLSVIPTDPEQTDGYHHLSNPNTYDVMDSPLPPEGYRDSPQMVEISNKPEVSSYTDHDIPDRSISPEPDGSAFARDAPERHSFSERHSRTRNAQDIPFFQNLKSAARSRSMDLMGNASNTGDQDRQEELRRNHDPISLDSGTTYLPNSQNHPESENHINRNRPCNNSFRNALSDRQPKNGRGENHEPVKKDAPLKKKKSGFFKGIFKSKSSKDNSSNKKSSRQTSLPPIARRIDHNSQVGETKESDNGPRSYQPPRTEPNHVQANGHHNHNHVNDKYLPNGTHSRISNNVHFNGLDQRPKPNDRYDHTTDFKDVNTGRRPNHNTHRESSRSDNRFEGDSKPMFQRAQEQQKRRDEERQFRERQIEQQREFSRLYKTPKHAPYRDLVNGKDRNGRIDSGSSSSSALSQPNAVNSPTHVSNGQGSLAFSSYREKSQANDKIHGQNLRNSLNPTAIQSPWRPPNHLTKSYQSGQANTTPELMDRTNYAKKMPRDANNFVFRQRQDDRRSSKNSLEISRPTQV
ncbi:uncharacterized protein TRIADDRAFT_55106 [Trichoplax adhaerens]|uniref:PDZ domain-containing protein n=1 Tax=Trichoplax adhaerens TaxID=10228 RepID=B3RQT3_TRIAD|nr:predicted protein [Trichoplax adhaerens]EDV26758.1 predicted protein [Trichoplax adhaerens]|eukprot:XP_002110754.1 predicted protein [Trichoplax adhaerens]